MPAKLGPMDAFKYVLVGGGVASAQAAVGIREIDPDGSVLLIGREHWWPYDRPPLSKGLLLGESTPEDAESKDPSWYPKNNVQVMRGMAVAKLDPAARTFTLLDGYTARYEKLLFAPGSSVKILDLPGQNMRGVHVLRTADDALAIRENMERARQAVMVGAGYIGVEVASACIKKGIEVTFVDPNDRPWSKFVSPQTGEFLRRYYEQRGARFLLGREVETLLGDGGVRGVRLKGGEELPADLVVLGVGVRQNLDLAREAGLEIDDRHGVMADETLRTSAQDIYAAGDVAAFVDATTGKRAHYEHYLNAKWTGKQAGRNMAGAGERYERVPYFFSDFLDLHMVLRGDPQGGRAARVIGDPGAAEFVELYAREDGSLAMGIAFGRDQDQMDRVADALEPLVRDRARPEDVPESVLA